MTGGLGVPRFPGVIARNVGGGGPSPDRMRMGIRRSKGYFFRHVGGCDWYGWGLVSLIYAAGGVLPNIVPCDAEKKLYTHTGTQFVGTESHLSDLFNVCSFGLVWWLAAPAHVHCCYCTHRHLPPRCNFSYQERKTTGDRAQPASLKISADGIFFTFVCVWPPLQCTCQLNPNDWVGTEPPKLQICIQACCIFNCSHGSTLCIDCIWIIAGISLCNWINYWLEGQNEKKFRLLY